MDSGHQVSLKMTQGQLRGHLTGPLDGARQDVLLFASRMMSCGEWVGGLMVMDCGSVMGGVCLFFFYRIGSSQWHKKRE